MNERWRGHTQRSRRLHFEHGKRKVSWRPPSPGPTLSPFPCAGGAGEGTPYGAHDGGRILNDGDESIDAAWEEISRAVVQTVRIGSRVLLQDGSGAELHCTVTAWEE